MRFSFRRPSGWGGGGWCRTVIAVARRRLTEIPTLVAFAYANRPKMDIFGEDDHVCNTPASLEKCI